MITACAYCGYKKNHDNPTVCYCGNCFWIIMFTKRSAELQETYNGISPGRWDPS